MKRPILNKSFGWQKHLVSSSKWTPFSTSFWSLSFLAVFLTMDPLLAQTPKFYGLTAQGGKDGIGAIIEYDINSKSLRDPAPKGFTNYVPGASPLYFQMTEFNGKLYGMTRNGGTFFGGVLFEYDPFTGVYLKKHDFSLFSNPFGGLAVVNGKLYGTTSSGENNAGVIFEYDPATEIYLEKFEFTAANRDRDGLSPSGGLVNVGDELFGMTSSGGVNNLGVIYSFNLATDTYNKIHDFESVNGSYPYGNLTLYNGDLYGSAYTGGTTGNGVLFKLSSGGAYSVLYHFLEGSDNTNQIADLGNLTVFNDKLYGTRPKGGSNDMGFVFEFDPTGSGITKYDFDGNNGKSPYGSLTEFDGKLYGMTTYGTPSDLGVLFEFNPVDKIISSRHNFAKESGSWPLGSLTNFNSKLYGMTSYGGLNDVGVIFEFDPIIPLYTKNLSFNETNGSNPSGSLINYNGKLFGTSDVGGSSNLGVLFEYDPATETYTKNIDFVGANGNKPNGALTAFNDKLYGVTSGGGRFINHGLIYEYDPLTKNYGILHSFDGRNGSSPQGGLTEYNGILYGLTSTGGTGNAGVLFGYNPINRGLTFFDFDGTSVNNPRGTLTVFEGKLYGTALGGTTGGGVLFEYDPSNGIFAEKYNFDQSNGWVPNGGLILYNSKLYGMTNSGGSADEGVIFEYDPVTNIYNRKHSFVRSTGSNPYGSLTEYEGKLYGMTQVGGGSLYGVIFGYDPASETYSKNADFNLINGGLPLYGQLTLFTAPPVELSLSATKVDESCPGRNGSIDLTITGATGTPVISWTGPDTFTAAVEDLNNLAAGLYQVVVTDDAGAMETIEVEILLTPDTEALVITILTPAPTATLGLSNTVTLLATDIFAAIDNCSGDLVYSPASFTFDCSDLGDNIISVTVSDAAGNSEKANATVKILGNVALSIDASESGNPVPVGSDAMLRATVTPATEGVEVTFLLDGEIQGTADTDASGLAILSVPAAELGSLPVVYKVSATVEGCTGLNESVAYLPIFDPNGNFVTGGGWIMSPAGAYMADESLEGKANFGFVSKYKKGSNRVDGTTEFEFHAGDLYFKSTMHESGTLVISGKKATYRGEGTINDIPGYNFTLVALDGNYNGESDPDQFRIKIWGASGIVYDNGLGADDNSGVSTVLGGGSINIHLAKGKGKGVRREITDQTNEALDHYSEEIGPKLSRELTLGEFLLYPNPAHTETSVMVDLDQGATVAIRIYDAVGRLVVDNEAFREDSFVQTFSLDGLAPGFYNVQVKVGDIMMTKRLIKK